MTAVGTMRVAVLRRAGDVVTQRRAVPRPGAGEVLVKVAAVGVCGSDTHYFDHGRIGRFVVDQPLVLGHEASGVIVELGPGVTGRQIGDRVSIEPGRPDFTCEQCLAGRYNLCPEMRFFATPPVDGAFAELVVVHQAMAHVVPDSVSDEAAALLEPLSVAVWACGKGAVGAGSRVLVTGAGAIGLLCVQVARALGATLIAVSDVNPARLAAASELGATDVIDARTAKLSELDWSPTVLLECSGHPPVVAEGIRALAPAGRAVLVGMGGDELPLPLSYVQEHEIEVTGTFRYANTWPTAIALVATGRVDLDRLVTSRHGLEQAPDALTAGRQDPAAIKAIVRPGS
ncbi:NAD(P)-dependent alcohol dehydrogenase [Kribbella sp. NPDC023972]|uniref:NAD(P)-dependent alcohol dehydrogenase n=1 Tax=Kribbella sp. NPDC023972 TaxID=3154795 RepID=UPI0033E395DC